MDITKKDKEIVENLKEAIKPKTETKNDKIKYFIEFTWLFVVYTVIEIALLAWIIGTIWWFITGTNRDYWDLVITGAGLYFLAKATSSFIFHQIKVVKEYFYD